MTVPISRMKDECDVPNTSLDSDRKVQPQIKAGSVSTVQRLNSDVTFPQPSQRHIPQSQAARWYNA